MIFFICTLLYRSECRVTDNFVTRVIDDYNLLKEDLVDYRGEISHVN